MFPAAQKAMHIEATLDQDNKLLREHSRKLELDNRDLTAKNRTQLEQSKFITNWWWIT